MSQTSPAPNGDKPTSLPAGGRPERIRTSSGTARSVLTAVLAGVAVAAVLALIGLAIGLLNGTGALRGLASARNMMLVLGALMMIVGAIGIASPERFGEAAAELGHTIGGRFGFVGHSDGLSWHALAIVAAFTIELVGIVLDFTALRML